jgi:long-subunit acyl-CoA synthetase (AMP-forming)
VELIARPALDARVRCIAQALAAARPAMHVVGLLADNGSDWIAVDLAARQAGKVLVPLPGFFTQAQSRHAVRETGMDALLCPDADAASGLGFTPAGEIEGLPLHRRDAARVAFPVDTAKVTFTSGTTGSPRGVCLTEAQQAAVSRSIADAARALGIARHLCLLPLAVLLENVAGARAALDGGMECIAPALARVGMSGSSGFDAGACLGALEESGAHSVILLPQMLHALTEAIESGAPRPRRLRLAAVGGARVSPALLARARAAGLPAYEGYGLSECASVVSLNLPGADRPGSAGRPLAHARVRIVEGEIHVGFDGRWRPTGDLGRVDTDGFLHIEGRRKHVLITSFGRNVSPEWPESELLAGSTIAQAAVFGEGRPSLCALIVAARPGVPDEAIEAQVRAANERLPDYARIGGWLRADAPFSPRNGQATANGRPRRDALWHAYGDRIDALL